MFKKILVFLEMIKFEHTVFALPFALSGAVAAANGIPRIRTIALIILAMVGGRTAAMAFNRIVDAKIDAQNPRTADRAIPKKIISSKAALVVVVVSSLILVAAAYFLNKLAFYLSPLAIAALLFYSYTKRFTSLSHLWLGLCLGISPVGAWIAVKGEISFAPMLLSAAVIFWTAGFDIIYSLQDVEFDKKMGLFSIPSRIGNKGALFISRAFHFAMVCLLVLFGCYLKLGPIYYAGVSLCSIFLIYEQSLVKPNDLSKLNTAFFAMNGYLSILFFTALTLDVLL